MLVAASACCGSQPSAEVDVGNPGQPSSLAEAAPWRARVLVSTSGRLVGALDWAPRRSAPSTPGFTCAYNAGGGDCTLETVEASRDAIVFGVMSQECLENVDNSGANCTLRESGSYRCVMDSAQVGRQNDLTCETVFEVFEGLADMDEPTARSSLRQVLASRSRFPFVVRYLERHPASVAWLDLPASSGDYVRRDETPTFDHGARLRESFSSHTRGSCSIYELLHERTALVCQSLLPAACPSSLVAVFDATGRVLGEDDGCLSDYRFEIAKDVSQLDFVAEIEKTCVGHLHRYWSWWGEVGSQFRLVLEVETSFDEMADVGPDGRISREWLGPELTDRVLEELEQNHLSEASGVVRHTRRTIAASSSGSHYPPVVDVSVRTLISYCLPCTATLCVETAFGRCAQHRTLVTLPDGLEQYRWDASTQRYSLAAQAGAD
jgi:hypothetical protein